MDNEIGQIEKLLKRQSEHFWQIRSSSSQTTHIWYLKYFKHVYLETDMKSFRFFNNFSQSLRLNGDE